LGGHLGQDPGPRWSSRSGSSLPRVAVVEWNGGLSSQKEPHPVHSSSQATITPLLPCTLRFPLQWTRRLAPQAATRRISHARQDRDACASGRVESVIRARVAFLTGVGRPGSEDIESKFAASGQQQQQPSRLGVIPREVRTRSRASARTLQRASTLTVDVLVEHPSPREGDIHEGHFGWRCSQGISTLRQLEPEARRNPRDEWNPIQQLCAGALHLAVRPNQADSCSVELTEGWCQAAYLAKGAALLPRRDPQFT
jgi:hypothetical protein